MLLPVGFSLSPWGSIIFYFGQEFGWVKKGKDVYCFGESQGCCITVAKSSYLDHAESGRDWSHDWGRCGTSLYHSSLSIPIPFLGEKRASRQGKQSKYGNGEQRWSGFYLLLPHSLLY